MGSFASLEEIAEAALRRREAHHARLSAQQHGEAQHEEPGLSSPVIGSSAPPERASSYWGLAALGEGLERRVGEGLEGLRHRRPSPSLNAPFSGLSSPEITGAAAPPERASSFWGLAALGDSLERLPERLGEGLEAGAVRLEGLLHDGQELLQSPLLAATIGKSPSL
tara:strand:- start:39 stop:539 length:501 start_codon:yes stop_codon:yes gene_type:complete